MRFNIRQRMNVTITMIFRML